jgi:hypothetical protein
MDGTQFRGLTIKSAGITTDDTEGTTLATLSAIGQAITFPKPAADAMASTATAETAIGQLAGVAGRMTSITFLPSAALTGDATNNAVITIRRRPAVLGTPAVTLATLTTTASWVAFVPVTFTLANVALVAGDGITLEIAKGGTGVAVPSGTLTCQAVLSANVNSLTQAP